MCTLYTSFAKIAGDAVLHTEHIPGRVQDGNRARMKDEPQS
jgi:hypothetical protein